MPFQFWKAERQWTNLLTLANLCPACYSRTYVRYFPLGGFRGGNFMVQEAVEGVPQRGLLLRRAHELLESIGQPTSETLLIQHLFGATTDASRTSAVWTLLLRQTLQSSTLFQHIN